MSETNKTRKAIVKCEGGRAIDRVLSTVKDYLPRNYHARMLSVDEIVIEGHDSHGWTMDGYVIPRLASGLIAAREVR